LPGLCSPVGLYASAWSQARSAADQGLARTRSQSCNEFEISQFRRSSLSKTPLNDLVILPS
jgi:hypothetical protein